MKSSLMALRDDTDRSVLLDRAGSALLALRRVPAPDPRDALAVLETAVDAAGPDRPALRALLLRQALLGAVILAADPDPLVREPVGPLTALDARLDELQSLVAEHGLTLFAADAQMLVARRALLDDDEDGALSAVSTALAHLEEPALVDLSPTLAEHRHNLQCSHRLVASTLVSLGMHDNAAPLVERARLLDVDGPDSPASRSCEYEQVRVALSWGLRLERAGRPGAERMLAAASTAGGLLPRAAEDQRPLLQAALVLARAPVGPAGGPAERAQARRDAAALAADGGFASQHDRVLVSIAGARALERAGEPGTAAALLETVRAHRPRGEPSLMLSVTRELARLRTRLASGCDAPNAAAKIALGDYTADLESELWALHQARVLSLRTRMAHDRLRREHGQVAALALSDPLTGLPNRRALDRALDDALAAAAARTPPAPLSVAMVDVDHFKRINDTVSHARGDEVLRQVAGALRSSLRAPDSVARYGGDEFVVVLPETAVTDAAAALGRAALAVGALPAGPDAATVTLSVGVVAVRPTEGAAEALARADAVMYGVKRTGGDAVRVVDGPSPPELADPRS